MQTFGVLCITTLTPPPPPPPPPPSHPHYISSLPHHSHPPPPPPHHHHHHHHHHCHYYFCPRLLPRTCSTWRSSATGAEAQCTGTCTHVVTNGSSVFENHGSELSRHHADPHPVHMIVSIAACSVGVSPEFVCPLQDVLPAFQDHHGCQSADSGCNPRGTEAYQV